MVWISERYQKTLSRNLSISNKKDANETSVNVKGAVDIIKMFEDYTPSANLENIFDLIE